MNIENFIKGWIVGNFEPSIIKTDDIEVAIKKYKKGDFEKSHYHKLATEYTIIVDGHVKMNNKSYITNEIIEIKPYEQTNFEAISDTITVVIKTKSVTNDKYIS